jgi:antitoxin VapB
MAMMEVGMNEHVKEPQDDGDVTVSIFKNGRSRAVRIPKEFELEGNKVVMVGQPDGSILMRTAVTAGLIDYLQGAEPWDGADFLIDDDDLNELQEIDL